MRYNNLILLGDRTYGVHVPPPVSDNAILHFKFSSGDEYLDGASININDQYKICIAMRIYVDDNYDADHGKVINIYYNNNYQIYLNFYRDVETSVYAYFSLIDLLGGDTSVSSLNAYSSGRWYVIHLIIDRTQLDVNDTAKLYVDGTLESVVYSAQSQNPFGHGDDYAISTGLNMEYRLDYLAILLGRTWTQRQINRMVNQKNIWPYTYYWPINEGSGSEIKDLGVNGADLTNNGGDWGVL